MAGDSAKLRPIVTTAGPQAIYENIAQYRQSAVYLTNEFGDEINLSANPVEQTIVEFTFEYFAQLASLSPKNTCNFRIYENNSPLSDSGGAPFNLLYQSGPFTIRSGFNTVKITGFAIPLGRSNLTWTVHFEGLSPGERAGLPLYDPPTVGSSPNDFWQRIDGEWRLFLSQGGFFYNFAARVLAVPGNPEMPPTITRQPMSQTVFAGTSPALIVHGNGKRPLFFQWNFQGVPLAGETNQVLNLINVPLSAAGAYTATLSNAVASINTEIGTLTVISPPNLSVTLLKDQVVLSWPALPAGFVLETSTSLGPAAIWSPVPGAPVLSGELLTLVLDTPTWTVFYRLSRL
jgi:hypothetical protein